MIGRRLVNGVESSAISVDDRGLQYGDGLFETMSAQDGRVRHFERHMERLAEGGRRLGLPVPDPNLVAAECERALAGLGAGSVKLIGVPAGVWQILLWDDSNCHKGNIRGGHRTPRARTP